MQSACCVKRVTARVGEAILDHRRLQISLLEGVGFQPKGRWKVGADWDCPHALSKTKKEGDVEDKIKKEMGFCVARPPRLRENDYTCLEQCQPLVIP